MPFKTERWFFWSWLIDEYEYAIRYLTSQGKIKAGC